MSLIALVIMPPAIIIIAGLVRRVRRVAKSQFVSLTRILSIAQETIAGIRVVKAFAVEQRLRRDMDAAVEDVRLRANKMTRLSARTSPVMETLGGVAIALVILYGGFSVVERGSDPGAFFAFITALLLAYDPARRLARLHVNLSAHMVGVRLMYEVLDRASAEASDEGTQLPGAPFQPNQMPSRSFSVSASPTARPRSSSPACWPASTSP
jgi:ATP-binding cassette subfamily B protein